MGLAFCGQCLHVASVIIKRQVNKESELLKQLEKLKLVNMPHGRTFAFMFACLGRGQHLYKKRNVESSVFKKVFPGVPLFGFFANGEIGFNFLPNFTNSEDCSVYTVKDESMEEEYPQYDHSYSTVFVLVSVI